MSWLLAQIFFTLIISNVYQLEAASLKVIPSTLIIGSVYCDTCYQEKISNNSHYIQGASVAVECSATSSRPSFRQEVRTDKNGRFQVRLPFLADEKSKKFKECEAKLIDSHQPSCGVASQATSSLVKLKPRNPSTHIFFAGNLHFKPHRKPIICHQPPKENQEVLSKKLKSSEKSSGFFPFFDQKYFAYFPPLPKLPPLPQLPPFPGYPYFHPIPKRTRPIYPPNQSQTPPPSDYNQAPYTGMLPPPPASEFYSPIPPFPIQPVMEFPGYGMPGIPAEESLRKKKKPIAHP